MRNNIVFSIILIFVVSFLPFSSAYAEGPRMIAEYLTSLGKAHYDEGDFVSAIHEFSKAVMIDPNNEVAQDYLKRLGVEGGYYARSVSQLSHVGRLSKYLDNYKGKVRSLTSLSEKQDKIQQALMKDKEALKGIIADRSNENKELRGQIKEFKGQAADAMAQKRQAIKASEKMSKKVAMLDHDLFQYKDRLRDIIEEKEHKDKFWKKSKKEFKSALSESKTETRQVKTDYEEQLFQLEREFRQFKHESALLESDRMKKIRKLEDILRKKRIELGFLNDRILFSEYKLTGRNRQMQIDSKQIVQLKEIIKNLENEVKILRAKKLDKRNIDNYIKKQKSAKQQDLVQFIKRQDQLIVDLKQKLMATRLEIDALGTPEVKADPAKIAQLQKQLEELRQELQEKEEIIRSQGEEYETLEARLKETEERLELVQRIMDDKEGQIEELEKQLTGVLSQFED